MIWLQITAACLIGNFTKNQQGYMSTENLFKPSNRKDCRGVVLANILESVGIPLDRSETYSHRVCNPCGRKISNLGSLYALIHKETRKPEENPSREAKRCQQRAKTREKDYFASIPQLNNGIYNTRHSQQTYV